MQVNLPFHHAMPKKAFAELATSDSESDKSDSDRTAACVAQCLLHFHVSRGSRTTQTAPKLPRYLVGIILLPVAVPTSACRHLGTHKSRGMHEASPCSFRAPEWSAPLRSSALRPSQ